jgi:hypothetical protein
MFASQADAVSCEVFFGMNPRHSGGVLNERAYLFPLPQQGIVVEIARPHQIGLLYVLAVSFFGSGSAIRGICSIDTRSFAAFADGLIGKSCCHFFVCLAREIALMVHHSKPDLPISGI